jgi:RsiW-degrading membrane proteinase PrsW (M82 family)
VSQIPPAPSNGTAAAAPLVDSALAADRRLVMTGVACAALSVTGIVLQAVGVAPPALAAVLVMVPVGIALRVLLSRLASSASPARRVHVLNLVSKAGLAVSALTLVIVLPRLTTTGGSGKFVADLVAELWPLVLLAVAASAVRTLSWRVYAGAGLTGFLAVTALSRVIDQPILDHLGDSTGFAAGWAPLTEEILKSLPVVAFVAFAVRRKGARPSAADIVLIAASTGAGFALYEDALAGRGGTHFSAVPPLSLILPSMEKSSVILPGHLVWTGLIGLGLAIALLYRGQHRFAWLALPVAAAVALGEHAGGNGSLGYTGHPPMPFSLLKDVTLGFRLSPLLLIAGTAWVITFEWRHATRRPKGADASPARWLRVTNDESARRSRQLAQLQTRPLPQHEGAQS